MKKIHRFILEFTIDAGIILVTDEEVVNQIRNVLKLKIGEQILLCDGRGGEVLVEILEISAVGVKLKVLEERENEHESVKGVTLYCAILKRENFDWVCQKATEIGVAEIVPLITKRTVKLDIKKERLEKIIKESAEQSGRTVLPILHEPVTFEVAVKQSTKNEVNVLFDVSGAPPAGGAPKRTGIFIGPEGGWDESELKIIKLSGYQLVSLGKLTLRAETAAIIAVYLAVN